MRFPMIFLALPLALTIGVLQAAAAEDAGQIKVSKGAVQIERVGPARAGAGRQRRAAGRRRDHGRRRLGGYHLPSTTACSRRARTACSRSTASSSTRRRTRAAFESSLQKGTLAVVSGKLAKQSPDAMKVRTPAAILGVRGTEFLVRTGDERLTALSGAPAQSRRPRAAGAAAPGRLRQRETTSTCCSRARTARPGALTVTQRRRDAHPRPALRRGARDRAPAASSGENDLGGGGPADLRRRARGAAGAADVLLPLLPRGHRTSSRRNPSSSSPSIFAEIARRPSPEIVVIGHTDRVGTVPYNDALSLRRAERVRDELVKARHRGGPDPGGGSRRARARWCRPPTRWRSRAIAASRSASASGGPHRSPPPGPFQRNTRIGQVVGGLDAARRTGHVLTDRVPDLGRRSSPGARPASSASSRSRP